MKTKTMFVCGECGYKSAKWYGKCPSCGSWGTLEEKEVGDAGSSSRQTSAPACVYRGASSPAVKLDELELPVYMRTESDCEELDRVLGGGLVNGSVVLLSGEPGIGKSTLLMQICGTFASKSMGKRVLYVSGEESLGQLKLRAKRLGVTGDGLYILIETGVEKIIAGINELKPDVVIVDSIQTMYSESSSSAPGSITQVKESTMRFIGVAKNDGISVILVGHVNKDGAIAGPKVLEHMVDAVLCFEGDRDHSYRIIRASKNRFGSTNEIGVFEMTGSGLREVPNPSEALMAGRPKNISGNCAVCVMEGSRPIITEIQALVTKTFYPSPKRTSDGIDTNRLCLISAVLEKRLGLPFSSCDTYMNVVGGLRLEDPATDLATALSLISGIKDKPVPYDVIAAGEIGLSGECRSISHIERRISEARRLGFSRILLPARNVEKGSGFKEVPGIEVVPVKGLYDAISAVFK